MSSGGRRGPRKEAAVKETPEKREEMNRLTQLHMAEEQAKERQAEERRRRDEERAKEAREAADREEAERAEMAKKASRAAGRGARPTGNAANAGSSSTGTSSSSYTPSTSTSMSTSTTSASRKTHAPSGKEVERVDGQLSPVTLKVGAVSFEDRKGELAAMDPSAPMEAPLLGMLVQRPLDLPGTVLSKQAARSKEKKKSFMLLEVTLPPAVPYTPSHLKWYKEMKAGAGSKGGAATRERSDSLGGDAETEATVADSHSASHHSEKAAARTTKPSSLKKSSSSATAAAAAAALGSTTEQHAHAAPAKRVGATVAFAEPSSYYYPTDSSGLRSVPPVCYYGTLEAYEDGEMAVLFDEHDAQSRMWLEPQLPTANFEATYLEQKLGPEFRESFDALHDMFPVSLVPNVRGVLKTRASVPLDNTPLVERTADEERSWSFWGTTEPEALDESADTVFLVDGDKFEGDVRADFALAFQQMGWRGRSAQLSIR